MKKYIVLILIVLSCSGCAAGAATAGYALKATTADELSPKARQSIVEEIKGWVNDNFQKK